MPASKCVSRIARAAHPATWSPRIVPITSITGTITSTARAPATRSPIGLAPMADGPDISEIVRRTAQANARLYKGWLDLSLEYFRGISEIFSGLPASGPTSSSSPIEEMDAGGGILVLEGEEGATVVG